jgi:hypothetical protein
VATDRGRGINVDPHNPNAHSPPPAVLRGYGIDAVRFVSRPESEAYAAQCQAAGIFVLGVIAGESNDYVLSHADVIQVGNEPDGSKYDELGNPSGSWVMEPDAYVAFFNRIRAQYPGHTLIAAGMTTRQGPAFPVEQVIPRLMGCAGIARHLYWPSSVFYTTPDETETVLAAFHAADELDGIPLWVTEWHPSPTRPELVEFIPQYAALLRRVAVRDFFYCWSDGQTPQRGLFEADGRTPKPELLPFLQAPCAPGALAD